MARVLAILAFVSSFFPSVVFYVHQHSEGDGPVGTAFQVGGLTFAVFSLGALVAMAVARQGRAALVWWVAGLCSVLLQVFVLVLMRGD